MYERGRLRVAIATCVLSASAVLGCQERSGTQADRINAIHRAAIGAPSDVAKVSAFKSTLPFIPELGVYVVEGDLFYNQPALGNYLRRMHGEMREPAKIRNP